MTVETLRASGWLDLLVARSVRRFRSARAFALALVAFSGLLACLVTNDVALFVVIPFTIIAGRMSDFDVEDVVILEIVSANVIGCLTPLGNPQNLFVFHRSGWSAMHFVAVMAPLVAWCAVGLVASLFLLKRSRELVNSETALPPRNDRMALAGAICFALVVLEVLRVTSAWPAAIAALVAGVFFLKRRMLAIDFSIIAIFFVAFLAIGWLQSFGWTLSTNLYVTGIALSQVISNVPATMLLSSFTSDWRELLYAVNAGGCGTIIASLANLLGWRIYVRESGREPRFFRRLTAINFVFLGWVATGGWLLLKTQ